MNEINALLEGSQSSSEAIRRIFHFEKSKRSKLTIGLICKNIKLSSRGYFNDVLMGRRILNDKYLDKLFNFFKLNELPPAATPRAISDLSFCIVTRNIFSTPIVCDFKHLAG